MKIVISNRVKNNIINIYDYLSKYSIKYANRTIDNIYSTIYSIKDSPYIGRYVPEISDKLFRERIYKNYRIIYYISKKTNIIYVQFIFSTRQNSKLFCNLHMKDFLSK